MQAVERRVAATVRGPNPDFGARAFHVSRDCSSAETSGAANATLPGIDDEILEATDASDKFETNTIRQWRHGRHSLTPRRCPSAHNPWSGSTPGIAFDSRVPKNAALGLIVGRTFRTRGSPASREGRA